MQPRRRRERWRGSLVRDNGTAVRALVLVAAFAVVTVAAEVGAASAPSDVGTNDPAAAPHADDAVTYLDYLYMEPNEGGSSAGHVAVAFGDRTFAYQRSAEGWLVLERDDVEHLRWLYAVLGNRAIERSRIAVSSATFTRLRDGFTRRWMIQERQRALLDRLATGERVLSVLAARAADPDVASEGRSRTSSAGAAADGIAIEGAGYFDPGTDGESPVLARLRDTVARAHGSRFVADRITTLEARIAALVPGDDGPPPAVVPDAYPAPGERFADRYLAAASGVAALATLQRAPLLDPASVVTVDVPPIGPEERAALTVVADRLVDALVKLAASARTDFGFPLLVGMARLAAIEQTLASGRLVVLDGFPADARRIPNAAVLRTASAARGLRDDACADLAAARHELVTADATPERALSTLEDAAGRCVELTRGLAAGRDVRVSGDLLVPARPGLVRDVVVPRVPPARLAAAAHDATVAHRSYARAFVDAYRYDLVRRNCVTETFATIDAVLGPDAQDALGGRVTAVPDRIVPALARRGVRRSWRLASSDVTPSYRSVRVAELARAGNPLAVRLRESNVLTSTVYRPSPDDSTFLFFTDDVLLLRPVLGAVNLAVGAGATVVGLLQAPLDRGAALERGLLGVLWSVPELFFVNVRKGSFDHVTREAALPVATKTP